MASGSTGSTKIALLLLAALTAANVYRAATQAITIDEAMTYNEFVAPPFFKALQHFDANNHVLYSHLCRASVAVFGLSEFTVRLPSILGGLLYFGGVFALARWAFGSGTWFLLSVALLSLNPFLLDYLSAARGYGLALAFLTWMLYALCRGRLYLAGIAMGLCLAANAVFLFPAAAMMAVFLLASPRRFWPAAERTLIPASALAFTLMIVPFSHADGQNFYFGATKLRDTAARLVMLSFFHHPSSAAFWGFDIDPLAFGYWLDKVAVFPVAAVLIFVAVMSERTFAQMRQGSPLTPSRSVLLLAGGSTIFAVALVIAARAWFGTPYPFGRTSLYAVPLVTLAVLAALRELRSPRWRRAGAAAACLCALQYALASSVSMYSEWPFDQHFKAVVRYLRENSRAREVRIGASWILLPELEFYRTRHRQWNWTELTREPFQKKFDFTVLAGDDAARAAEHGLTVVYRVPDLVVAR